MNFYGVIEMLVNMISFEVFWLGSILDFIFFGKLICVMKIVIWDMKGNEKLFGEEG